MPTRRIARTRWPVVAPARLRSHERSISRSWKARTFSMATAKLSFTSKVSDSTARSISLCGTRISCGRMPSKRSLYSRRATSPLSRTSSTIRRAALRTFSERNPPGRRNWPTTSRGSLALASIVLANGSSAPIHSIGQGHDLAVAQTVGAAVGNQTRRRSGDLIEHHQIVLVQGRPRGGDADDTDVGGAVLDENGHIGGPAHDKLGVLRRVYEPAPVLPNEGRRQPGPLERGERVGEDGAFRHGDPQPTQESTVLATESGLIKTNSPAGSAIASLTPPGAGYEIQAASTILAYSWATSGGISSQRCNTGTPSPRSAEAAWMPPTSPPTRTSRGS